MSCILGLGEGLEDDASNYSFFSGIYEKFKCHELDLRKCSDSFARTRREKKKIMLTGKI